MREDFGGQAIPNTGRGERRRLSFCGLHDVHDRGGSPRGSWRFRAVTPTREPPSPTKVRHGRTAPALDDEFLDRECWRKGKLKEFQW